MHTEIRAGDGPATLDLYRWLRTDPELRHRVALRQAAPDPGPGEGAMGAFDVVDAVVVDTLALLDLFLSYLAYRETRRTAGTVTVTRGGTTVTVRGETDEEALRLVRALLDGAENSGNPGPGPGVPETGEPGAV
ncbi:MULTISPECIES: effector-associated constant component EACC1 [unclassified Streptomyces]|uniref:effector-associated constant component EACC1 n=1 Tax=unclassified Streptomyces TaxID=2593676 RepID=UPI0006900562|nr:MULTISPECIES: hypothetical protein [unclassified Streptomyces]